MQTDSTTDDIEVGVTAVRDTLRMLARAIDLLSVEEYAAATPAGFDGTIGGHVRHCLDHVEALLQAIDTEVVDYDHRQRGTAIETDPAAALGEIDRQVSGLAGLPGRVGDAPVRTRLMFAADGLTRSTESSWSRELGFVLSHTIHHSAMIAAMIRCMGGDVPERFGYAPSTLAHQQASHVHRDDHAKN